MDKNLQEAIDKAIGNINNPDKIKVLDIGCGSTLKIALPSKMYICGIDISQKQLQNNPQLNEKIFGDIHSFNFVSSNFDVAIAWFVLEHLQNPDKALINILKALRKNGIIIIGVPYCFSILSLLTKFTPFRFHIFVYKHIFNDKRVWYGTLLLFKTFLRFSISPGALKKFAHKNNLSIEYSDLRKSRLYIKNKFYKSAWLIFMSVIKLFSLGRIVEHGQYFLILKKK